jgi:hypothetical protein
MHDDKVTQFFPLCVRQPVPRKPGRDELRLAALALPGRITPPEGETPTMEAMQGLGAGGAMSVRTGRDDVGAVESGTFAPT